MGFLFRPKKIVEGPNDDWAPNRRLRPNHNRSPIENPIGFKAYLTLVAIYTLSITTTLTEKELEIEKQWVSYAFISHTKSLFSSVCLIVVVGRTGKKDVNVESLRSQGESSFWCLLQMLKLGKKKITPSKLEYKNIKELRVN